MKKARYFSTEEKLALLRRIDAGERLSAVAEETGVLRKSLYEWRAAFRALGAAGLNRKRGPKLADAWRLIRRRPTPALPPHVRPTNWRRPRCASPNSSGWRDANRSDLDFFAAKPCGHGTRNAAGAARPPLRRRRKSDRRTTARRTDDEPGAGRASVRDLGAFARQLLSLART